MTQRPTIVLFDIDGTLVTTAGIARQAFTQAVREQWGDAGSFSFSFGGMTDPLIMRRGLAEMGIAFEPDVVFTVLDRYLGLLEAGLRHDERHRTYSGCRHVVAHVAGQKNVAAGLGTGNVERAARLKLEPFGFNPLLPFGGFGSDAESRDDVIRIGARRGAAQLGLEVQQCRLVIVGDTPRDVAAAHANGGECVAVCTGVASRSELAAAAPRFIYNDMTDAGLIDAILGPNDDRSQR